MTADPDFASRLKKTITVSKNLDNRIVRIM